MNLTVTTPNSWNAASNGIEKRYKSAAGEGRRVLERNGIEWFLDFYEDVNAVSLSEFEQTPRISTYLYAICAGPYEVYSDNDPMYVPQKVFVRQSLIENLKQDTVFGITKTTLDFYQQHFGARYPFTKVDHVFCPDYKYGAMENVGCITYGDDRMCGQKNPDIPMMTWFTVVIQHELCHMWFGNLVTMDWWNDLWLNEAFATALSYKACSVGGAFVDPVKDESWLHMANYKRWGLNDDLMPSNHCIQADCPTTDAAESLIDGITYGKGSSMIKQLIFLMGWETFCNGLKIYFRRHQWSNTTLPDFIGALQSGYDELHSDGALDLFQWSKDWLQTKGVNKFTYEYEQQEGKFTSFRIRQTHCKYADTIHRKQRIEIGFYNEDGSFVRAVENVAIEAQEVTEVQAIKGLNVPAAILLNNSDWGFGHFTLNESSVNVFENSLSKINSSINRAVILGQFIIMMRQIEYPATRLPRVLNQLIDEKNQNLINTLYMALVAAQTTYLPQESVPKFNKETAQFFFKKAAREAQNPGLLMFCLDKGITFATEQEHLKMTAEWILNDSVVIDGQILDCKLTANHKYAILQSYFASKHFTVDEKKHLEKVALAEDNSDNAKKTSEICH